VKVLLINKFYHLSGGAERYVFEWEELLRQRGHEVMIFSMDDTRNRPSLQSAHFVRHIRFDKDQSLAGRIGAATRSIWNRDAARRLDALLQAEGPPDIAHVHAFVYQLTPSILGPLAARNIPVIQTCHEYAHICVNQRLYNQRTDTICEACVTGSQFSPVWKRCIKGSLAASTAGCVAGLTDLIFGTSRKRIKRFIVPSAFMRSKMMEAGMDGGRIFHLPHAVDCTSIPPSESAGDAMLFFGRLVAQKGIGTFLEAAALAPNIPCRVLGNGPLEESVRREVDRRQLHNVEFLGHLEGPELWEAVGNARAVVAPSEWYEPFGLVILEAMAAKRAVIASDIAGPSEIVRHEATGLLVSPHDATALAEAMKRLWDNPDEAMTFGARGREIALRDYAPEQHYDALMGHFREVVG
jgi:glycosyltransferase involved in cell wall biosynthesis